MNRLKPVKKGETVYSLSWGGHAIEGIVETAHRDGSIDVQFHTMHQGDRPGDEPYRAEFETFRSYLFDYWTSLAAAQAAAVIMRQAR